MTVLASSVPPRREPSEPRDLSTILRRRLASPDTSVIGFYDRSARTSRVQSQAAFLGRAAGLGSTLRAAGVRAGDPVVVSCAAPEAALLGFCASVLIGAVPAIVAGRVAFDGTDVVERKVTDTMRMLGGRCHLVVQAAGGVPSVDVDVDAGHVTQVEPDRVTAPADPPDLGRLPALSAVAPCHVQLTSGSTGEGRGIVVSHRGLLANFAALRHGLALAPGDVFAGWLPLNHDMGLVGQTLMALADGIDLYLQSPFDFMADPLSWLRTISEQGATFSASPNFGYEHVLRRAGDADVTDLRLSRWRSACCGAEPVSRRVAATFSRRFAAAGLASTAFTPCYGLAEATLAVTVTPVDQPYRAIRVTRPSLARLGAVTVSAGDGEPREDEIDVVALGPPMLGVAVRLVDEAGATIDDPLRCGEVVVSGSSVAAGTIGADGTVVPFPADGVHTGDIGFVEGGDLFVVERTKNVVIRHGHNYSSAVLEQTLARLAGVGEHNVLVLDLDLAGGTGLTGVVAVELGADPEPVLDAVVEGLDRFELPPERLVTVARGALPRTTSGKKRHVAAREMLRTGELVATAVRELRASRGPAPVEPAGHSSDLARQVLGLVAEHVRRRDVDVPVVPASRFLADLAFDSLALLDLAVSTEERLGITVLEAELAELHTVGDLIAVAGRALRGPAAGPGITATLAAVEGPLPRTYNVVDEQRGREVRIDGRWLTDFASCNYLGLDLHPDVMQAIPAAVARWGVHPSWTRAVASPAPYRLLERRLADLVGVHDTIVFPTVTLLHFGVLPRLAGGSGAIVIDSAAHNSLHEAGALAGARGTAVTTFAHGSLHDLEAKLSQLADRSTRVIAVDGIYSMSGSTPDLRALVGIAEHHDAVVYVDDAHGFGVLGADPGPGAPYGRGGGGLLRHAGVDRSRIVYVAGLSKAFSSMAAFVGCRDDAERHRFEMASTMIFSGPVPVASLASALAGLDVNAVEGDRRRARLWSLTERLLDGVRALGLTSENASGFPIVNVVLGRTAHVLAACEVLWEHGILLTPAIFPAVPLHRGGVRFTLTADHTDAQVDHLLEALAVVRTAVLPAQSLSTRTTAL
jgi:7-keto-8-aminopelargonate synthetase-like enzyme/acyl-CoA synthetase (AMP-forming)/AMP-acid ligase II/acyl carrier protein